MVPSRRAAVSARRTCPCDLPLADDHRVEPAGDGEQVGGGVGAGADPQVRVHLRRRCSRSGRRRPRAAAARADGVSCGVVDLQVQLEPVARREDDGTGHEPVGRRAHELGRDGVDVRRETFQHIEVEVVVTGGEGQQHHVPELIISTFVRHNRRREPSFLAPPRRRPHDEFFAGPCIFRRGPVATAGVVHAAGRPVAAGVPQGARRHGDAGRLPPTRRSPARSPCSRCAGTTWTRRSSSPTSWCRSSSRASTWRSSPASAR